jgi:hypothetical protein
MRPRYPDRGAFFPIGLHVVSIAACITALGFALRDMLGGYGLKFAMTGSVIAVSCFGTTQPHNVERILNVKNLLN